MITLTVEDARAALDYDPVTGVFTRKGPSFGPQMQEGAQPGHLSRDGYRYIRVKSKRYLAHRLAWFLVHGYWPAEVDHINLDKDDNRITNLREATRSQNMANASLPTHNTSGVKGVHFDKVSGRWMAYMMVEKRFKNLGRFDTQEAAQAARELHFRKAFGDFARA